MAPSTSGQARAPKHALRPAMPHAGWRRGLATLAAAAMILTGVSSATAQDSPSDALSDAGATVVSDGQVVTDPNVIAATLDDDTIMDRIRQIKETNDGADTSDGDANQTDQTADADASGDAAGQKAEADQTADADAGSAHAAADPAPAAATETLGGRDFEGQVTKTINGKTYILIGNEQQLRAIGTGKKVTGRVWQVKQHRTTIFSEWKDAGDASVAYVGDADLDEQGTLVDKAYSNPSINLLDRTYYFATDAAGNRVDVTDATYGGSTGKTYTTDANYIVFRNIDLSKNAADQSDANWSPLMFSGTMLGAISQDGAAGTLWSTIGTDGASVNDTAARPVVSHVNVNHADANLDVSVQQGVGFFATIAGKTAMVGSSLGSAGTAVVANLKLSDVSVASHATKAYTPPTLLNTLTTAVGTLLDVVLKLVSVLTFGKVNLDLHLADLLSLHQNNPSNLATGGFAGRIYGDVKVSGCEVEDVTVSSEADMLGGFVGYTEGSVSYDVVSGLVGDLAKLLTAILNVIPFLGLGDLVEWLIDGGLGLDQLIPTGYYNPLIENSAVNGFKKGATIGSNGISQVGGFVGTQAGAFIENSSVASDEPFAVTASQYAGGFSGVSRNGNLGGLLSSLGVDLLAVLRPQSLLEANTLAAKGGVTVTAANYAGGFAGGMANSYAINTNVSGTVGVKATDSHAGGFAGHASVGWGLELGSEDSTSTTVVKQLTKALTGLVSSGSGSGSGELLTFAGVTPSAILGTSMDANVTVSADGSYAGGVIGAGSGTVIAPSTTAYLDQLSFWKYGTDQHPKLDYPAEQRGSSAFTGIVKVSAGKSYAGGIAGSLQPVMVAGLLNNVLQLGNNMEILSKINQFSAFAVDGVTVTGPDDGYAVIAGHNFAGGAIGCSTGGKVTNTAVANVATVTAENEAGGFVGFSGPGKAVGATELNVLDLITISGLLSVAEAAGVTISGSSVTGVAGGLKVTATGINGTDDVNDYTAGGFYGQANSTTTIDSHARQIGAVTASIADDATTIGGTAGGFVGLSSTGGLIDAVDGADESKIPSLISVDNLLGAVPYLLPVYVKTDVSYVNGGHVQADVAGGYAGDFQGGYVNKLTSVLQNDKDHGAEYAAKVEEAKAAPVAVINIDHVTGGAYAGGFGGKVRSGALASVGQGGLSVLGKLNGVNLSGLLSLAQAYVPFVLYAGVKSDEDTFTAAGGNTDDDPNADHGLMVSAKTLRDDSNSGSAGGFAGYVSAAQISTSSVNQLRHTTVTAPSDMETTDVAQVNATYFNDAKSTYAVDAARYAGGYIGRADLGSTAGVGDSVNVLGGTIKLSDLVSALNVMISTIEESDVTGGTAGYAVRASNGQLGTAGGFVGDLEGGHIQHSNAHEFAYIIGQVAAGGYAGVIQPGAAADVVGNGSVLKQLVDVDGALSLLQDFVPTIRNSSTDAIICGGAVRAQAASDGTTRRGMAGGYVGRNRGGQIWGNNTSAWSSISGKAEITQRIAYASRIRSVYGQEIAGGYTGLMESADTAEGGSISALYGLIKVDNIAQAFSMVYPTEEHTKVTGPLRNMAYSQWENWRDNVGKYGPYGKEFTDVVTDGGAKDVTDQASLDKFLENYIFGFNVVAGRASYEKGVNLRDSGVAGGHVGIMRTGTVTDGQSMDVRNVTALRAAGGYAGTMEAGTAASFGSVQLLGNKGIGLNLGQMLGVAQVFVPVAKSSSVAGYRKGMRVTATGTDVQQGTGNAGGYVALALGAQIWGDRDSDGKELDLKTNPGDYTKAAGANVTNLRKVSGCNNVGGFVGVATAGAVADVDTEGASGFLYNVLHTLIANSNPAGLVQVLQATIVTIRGAHVSADSTDWGFTVDGGPYTVTGDDGAKTEHYALNAGGFAGSLQAAILGDKDSAKGTGTEVDTAKDPASLTVSDLRSVEGGQYAGGFFGLADISSVASVGGGNAATGTDVSGSSSNTNLLLSLLKLGNVGVLEAFRTFLYDGQVAGVPDGIQVNAHVSTTSGMLDSTRFTGAAGGFGGGLINGSVKKSGVTNLNSVKGLNYVGGFIGHLGKSGTVAADNTQLGTSWFNALGATAGVLDIWGSHVGDSKVSGIADGYTVTATHAGDDYQKGTDKATGREVAGGFTGYADLARVKGCVDTGLKKVTSGEIAGGFVGETKRAYLVDAQVNSALLELVLGIVNALVKALYLPQAQRLGVINLGGWLPDIFGKVFDLKVLADGELLYVNLFGLKIGVALSQADANNQQQTDVAIVTIGDSVIKLPCNKDGLIDTGDKTKSNLTIQLIKGNRTRVEASTVTGITDGYDVFGGGAGQGSGEGDGIEDLTTGYAGGFAGLNDEGVLANDHMVLADTVRGTSGLVDPFANTKLKSNWDFSSMSDILGPVDDGNGGLAYNTYRVYRSADETRATAYTSSGTKIATREPNADGTAYDAFTMNLFAPVNTYDADVPTSGAAGDGNTTWVGIKGAKRAESATAAGQQLDAYVSAAKAVLMLDTLVGDNSSGVTPEPDDGQDPCGYEACRTIDLTLNKVWKNDRPLERPQSVTLQITVTYTDADGNLVTPNPIICRDDVCNPSEQKNPWTVEITADDASTTGGNTWRKVIKGLPIAFKDADGVVRPYTYSVTETKLTYPKPDGKRGETIDRTPAEAGYQVDVSYNSRDYVVTVTNAVEGLPNTGGMGTMWFVILGVLLMLLGTAWYLRNNRARAGAVATGPVAAGGAAPGGAGTGFLSGNLGKRLFSVVLSGGRASSPVVLSGGRSPKPKDLFGKRGRHA